MLFLGVFISALCICDNCRIEEVAQVTVASHSNAIVEKTKLFADFTLFISDAGNYISISLATAYS